MKTAIKPIPERFIYEMVDGQPIYYKGYKEFLKASNETEQSMGSSLLQSIIITNLVIYLHQQIGQKYYLFTNELGIQFSKGNWRAADIAIYGKKQIDIKKATNKYTKIPPKIVIEIDTKADVDDIKDTFTYYNKKTEQLIEFGVEKVIWIFTDTKKILIAETDQEWRLVNWTKDVLLMDNTTINIQKIIDEI